jgi:hypothetical protein
MVIHLLASAWKLLQLQVVSLYFKAEYSFCKMAYFFQKCATVLNLNPSSILSVHLIEATISVVLPVI